MKQHEHMRSELGDHCNLCGDPMPPLKESENMSFIKQQQEVAENLAHDTHKEEHEQVTIYYYNQAELDYLTKQIITNTVNHFLAGVEDKKFVPADNVQIGGIESDEWKLVPKEDGMYCLNCERFIPEEGCLCGMVSIESIRQRGTDIISEVS